MRGLAVGGGDDDDDNDAEEAGEGEDLLSGLVEVM